MKKYKEFRGEQQYITEVGPLLGMLTGLLGLGVAGWAGIKTAKAAKDKFKGYRESQAEKKENSKAGITISIKKFNPETGKIEPEPVDIPGGDKRANVNDEEITKLEKKEQAKQDKANKEAASTWKAERDASGLDDKGLAAQKAKVTSDKNRVDSGEKKTDAKDITFKYMEFDRGEGKLISVTEPSDNDMFDDEIAQYQKDKTAQAKKQLADYKAAQGGTDEEEPVVEPETGNDEEDGDEEDGLAKDDDGNLEKQKDAQKVKDDTGEAPNGWITDPEDETGKTVIKKKDKTESKVLSFGEYISEGVMSDLLKAGKSKKDSEITLDDGADIPIDPLTSQILVKYIEGLSSSEKNRTIQQIQRTERAFMKVLGKAHENI
jgi:hypothetical protein